MKKHILCVCSQAQDRSPCCASLFENNNEVEAKFCGIFLDAEIKINKNALDWSDIILCMQHEHKAFIFENYPKHFDKIIVLNIPNDFRRYDFELKKILKRKLKDYNLI